MLGKVTGASAVCIRGLAGYAEIANEVFAFCELLFFKSENSTGACE